MRCSALRQRAVLLLLFLLGQLFATRATAQEQGTSELARAAKAAFDAGVKAAEAKDYERARSEFQRSRQLVVKASTLLNLAVVDLKLGLAEEALEALTALDASAVGPAQERMRERAAQLRSEAEGMQRAQAEARPPPEPPAPAPEPVRAEAQPEPRSFEPAAPDPSAPTQAAASLRGPRTLLALAGVLAGGAVGAALWWSDRAGAADACNPGGERVCVEQAQIAREEKAAMAVTLSLGASAGALATGGALWFVRRKRDVRVAQLSAWAGQRGAGFAVSASF